MESELSPDKEKNIPPVPIKTYQWEDLRRARDAGGYPWTHLLKAPLEGEITAEDIIRETTPRRSMSREFSRSRTRSPCDRDDVQRILNLDSSPGSSRRHTEEGEDEGVHIPNFSKEVSCESPEDVLNEAVMAAIGVKRPESQASTHLSVSSETPKNVSPKSILKRRTPEQQFTVTETRGKTKCCHPLVNKIKHLADKTLQKLEGKENEKSPSAKRKKNEESQEIRQLKSSPGAVRRQKFSAIKLGDSDDMSKTETPTPRKKKEHIYEDIEHKSNQADRSAQYAEETEYHKAEDENKSNTDKEIGGLSLEQKSIASQDPSLVAEDTSSLKEEEHVMEQLHKAKDTNKEAIILDDEMDPDEPNVDEIFENQLDETRLKNDSPKLTITEIVDEYLETNEEEAIIIPIETSPTPSPREIERKKTGSEARNDEWSKPNSDHEYEIIEKPAHNISYGDKSSMNKKDDEILQYTSSNQEILEMGAYDDNDDIVKSEAFQRDIEERYFLNTPSTVSRTECEISTSQVDSSALENLPLKRDSRSKNPDKADSKMQQRFKEGTGKLKTQAGKLKTKLQTMKTKQFTMPERPKFKFPDRTKFTLPERPKFVSPDKRKFSLPDRPKFKKINITEKLTFGDRKKFTLPDRPRFNVPDLSKFKMPERPKINFPNMSRKKDGESSSGIGNEPGIEFEAKTYPRLFGRKKKNLLPKTSSSPTLNREDTPPPTFTFTRVKKTIKTTSHIPDNPELPREYGNVDNQSKFEGFMKGGKQFETTYDFDNLEPGFMESKPSFHENSNAASTSDISPTKQKYSHINEINNDEFFVRPRGISRENIQVREYLSDEIRQAFKIPKNVLASMGSDPGVNENNVYNNEPEADPELLVDDEENIQYSTEDLNDKDDGYYTFPPVRPSRSKRKKKDSDYNIQYIDSNINASIHFSEVDLGLIDDPDYCEDITESKLKIDAHDQLNFTPAPDLHSIHEYANDDIIEYPGNVSFQPQTLPMPPKRKKKFIKDHKHSSLNDFNNVASSELWDRTQQPIEDVIVYRTEHGYSIDQAEPTVTEQSPLPPRRNRSRSSRGTSLCDDDRTSHGAESLTLDTHLPQTDEVLFKIRHESPGYATVDKSVRRSTSKTPPVRRRKSSSSDRKYYTVGSNKPMIPDRPPRKKSSSSLMTLDRYKKSVSADITQYVEIDEPQSTEVHKDLCSGIIINKMKDRPLPPPPRPPRGPKRDKSRKKEENKTVSQSVIESTGDYQLDAHDAGVVEIEVSTQTDPLPDDVDFELGMDENIDISMTSSLKDIVDEDSIFSKSHGKLDETTRTSRPVSRSEKSLKLSDPKISELSKPNVGRTSPTVILVERRVSSPTRINERDVMLTEASLTVQHIDIDESQIPDVPPLPQSRGLSGDSKRFKNSIVPSENRALDRVADSSRDVELDNLITQRLQVQNLDVSRLNVSELQASKILVSEVEGMTLQVNELDTKSGHISVSGIEFSQSVIDEIVKKFSEISTNQASTTQTRDITDYSRPESREEQTQTENETVEAPSLVEFPVPLAPKIEDHSSQTKQHEPAAAETPPQRPPPPDLTPLLYSYLQDITMPATSFYTSRPLRERPFTEFHESQHHSPPAPTRRPKRKPAAPHTESSSDEDRPRPSPRRMPPPVKAQEPTVTEAGAQFLRVCQNSISRTLRNIFNSFMSYISGTEDKKDMQMALVIFLVLIAGLIMFGLSDSRTVHHHHWEFFNPPDNKQ